MVIMVFELSFNTRQQNSFFGNSNGADIGGGFYVKDSGYKAGNFAAKVNFENGIRGSIGCITFAASK